jgi:hypothetical protein
LPAAAPGIYEISSFGGRLTKDTVPQDLLCIQNGEFSGLFNTAHIFLRQIWAMARAGSTARIVLCDSGELRRAGSQDELRRGAFAINRSEMKNEELVVGASGFEPETSCAQGRRATRLRYAPT